MVHRASFGLAWMEFLRYQEKELLPTTHSPVSVFVCFISYSAEALMALSLLVVLVSTFLSFISLSLIVASCHSEQEKGWIGPNPSAGEEGVFWMSFVLVLAFLGLFISSFLFYQLFFTCL